MCPFCDKIMANMDPELYRCSNCLCFYLGSTEHNSKSFFKFFPKLEKVAEGSFENCYKKLKTLKCFA